MVLTGLIAAAALAATDAPQAEPAAAQPPRTFLRGAEASRADCVGSSTTGEVVVCGRDDAEARYRLKSPEDERFAARPLRAETTVLGNETLEAHGKQTTVGGFSAPRAMVTLSFPF